MIQGETIFRRLFSQSFPNDSDKRQQVLHFATKRVIFPKSLELPVAFNMNIVPSRIFTSVALMNLISPSGPEITILPPALIFAGWVAIALPFPLNNPFAKWL